MRKTAPYFLVFSIIFTSCSSNENEVLEDTQEKLLQSYTLKRDASGAYSIDFKTSNNTDVTTVTNIDKSNEIILAETSQKTATKHTNDYTIENDQLKIGFLETNRGKHARISIEDENITFAKNSSSKPNYLNTYSINVNNDGEYKLDFKVEKGVKTKFIFNDQTNTYEVHLSKDELPLTDLVFSGSIETKNDFSITLNISQGEKLNLNFVNYYKLEGKGQHKLSYYSEEKPRTSVDI